VLAITQRLSAVFDTHGASVRVRVEIMGSQKCRIVGKSRTVLIMIDPIISTRTRNAAFLGRGAWSSS
jgi:hypothetical protein